MQIRRCIKYILIILMFNSAIAYAKEPAIQDKIIGSTFKVLAKAFVAGTNIDKLKENNIKKLNKMNQEKFRREYSKAYEIIKACPEIVSDYKLKEDTSKEELIQILRLLDKKKFYEIIDSIPDKVIADEFKKYLAKKKQEIQESNLANQIKQLWNKVTKKAQ